MSQPSGEKWTPQDYARQMLEELRQTCMANSLKLTEIQGCLLRLQDSREAEVERLREVENSLKELQTFRAQNADLHEEVDRLKSFMWKVTGGIALGVVLLEAVVFFLATTRVAG